jgi:hypothetical protein
MTASIFIFGGGKAASAWMSKPDYMDSCRKFPFICSTNWRFLYANKRLEKLSRGRISSTVLTIKPTRPGGLVVTPPIHPGIGGGAEVPMDTIGSRQCPSPAPRDRARNPGLGQAIASASISKPKAGSNRPATNSKVEAGGSVGKNAARAVR